VKQARDNHWFKGDAALFGMERLADYCSGEFLPKRSWIFSAKNIAGSKRKRSFK
jgi:hypothetical protein